mmetsp:Transcript_4098/g.9706  ORF Transcript_4098/g.9706 Transcript_4098/m.9706 type:complete len:317 (-) Transcript_4098:421-1371(-)
MASKSIVWKRGHTVGDIPTEGLQQFFLLQCALVLLKCLDSSVGQGCVDLAQGFRMHDEMLASTLDHSSQRFPSSSPHLIWRALSQHLEQRPDNFIAHLVGILQGFFEERVEDRPLSPAFRLLHEVMHLVQKELVDDALFDHDAVLQREHEMRHVRRRQQRPPSRLQRCDPQRRQRVVVAARLRKSVRRRIEEVEVAEAMRLVRLFVLNQDVVCVASSKDEELDNGLAGRPKEHRVFLVLAPHLFQRQSNLEQKLPAVVEMPPRECLLGADSGCHVARNAQFPFRSAEERRQRPIEKLWESRNVWFSFIGTVEHLQV